MTSSARSTAAHPPLFPVGAADGEDGELFLEIIPVDDAEFFDGMGRGTVLPAGANALIGVPDAVIQNLPDILHKDLVSVTHDASSPKLDSLQKL